MRLSFNPQPKPDRFERKAKARQTDREHATKRDQLRRRVYALDKGCCRKCGRKVYLKLADAPTALAVGHVDEWVPRSAGGSDVDERNCILYCAECHLLGKHGQGAPERRFIPVAVDPEKLMRGAVEFIPAAPIRVYISVFVDLP